MFFIAGTKGETTTLATGEFYCPGCEGQRTYHHNQVHEKATVFFIPVLNLKLLGEYIECQSCSNTYRLEVLDYERQPEPQQIAAMYLDGIRKVMITMMFADGIGSDSEKSAMREIMPQIVRSVLSNDQDIQQHTLDDTVLRFIDLMETEIRYREERIRSGYKELEELEEYLNNLFPYLNETGKETIIKVAYWMSIADGKAAEEEMQILTNLAKRFEISKAHLRGIISEVDENVSWRTGGA
jgi:uncharacterized tellurite resistance protein B-like protein